MSLLKDALQEKKFDTRVLEKHLARRVASHQELEGWLKSTQDVSDNAEWVSIDSLEDEETSSNKNSHR